MAEVVKFKASEIALTTANTVNLASVVRLISSNTATSSTITLANTGGTIATFTLGYMGTDYSEIYVAKEPTDTLATLFYAYYIAEFARMLCIICSRS